jgi:chemotaxis protein methyltransferase CheR
MLVVMSTESPRRASTPSAPLAADYVRFCEGIVTLTGIDLRHYRPAQMERRMRAFALRHGATDLVAYLEVLRREPAARDGFLDRMTINVSELFRNPERFDELEKTHLPRILAANGPGLRVWSAGCSYGAEIYSLAILLGELAPGARHQLIAADIDEQILARARIGWFTTADMRNVTADRRRRWFTQSPTDRERWTVIDELKRAVEVRRMDLLKDAYPRDLDMIACRNVVIYFNDDAKDQIYRRRHRTGHRRRGHGLGTSGDVLLPKAAFGHLTLSPGVRHQVLTLRPSVLGPRVPND